MFKYKAKPSKPRLSREKRMTICVGVLSNEGIVIAADTQETAGDTKRAENKILSFTRGLPCGGSTEQPPICGILTGAGDAGYLEALSYKLVNDLADTQQMAELEKSFGAILLKFHKEHLWPLASSPDPPAISVLAAFTCGWSTSLFVSHGSSLRKSWSKHVAIGYGAHYARSLLERIPVLMTVREAQIAAGIVIHATKEQVEYCGKDTTMSSLMQCVRDPKTGANCQPPTPIQIGIDLDRFWEARIEGKWNQAQRTLIRDLIAEEYELLTRPSNSQKSTGLQ